MIKDAQEKMLRKTKELNDWIEQKANSMEQKDIEMNEVFCCWSTFED